MNLSAAAAATVRCHGSERRAATTAPCGYALIALKDVGDHIRVPPGRKVRRAHYISRGVTKFVPGGAQRGVLSVVRPMRT